MPIWNQTPKPDVVALHINNTLCEHMGIKITEIGDDFIRATMPVNNRTQQLMGVLHGGASCVLAETIGSIAANLCCKPGYVAVGLDINANHLRAGRPPYVTGVARPLHVGGSTSVWEIKITDSDDKLVCISRLTMAVIKNKASKDANDKNDE